MTEKIEMEQTGYFSGLFVDYIKRCSNLEGFYSQYPQIENFEHFFDKFDGVDREVLTTTLHEQHKGLGLSEKQSSNISLLKKSNTFTITTGHQLNIFCGPLFFIYKIISTIKGCEQ